MGPCLDENTVLDLCAGSLDAASASTLSEHIDACAACRRLVALAAGDGERAADAPLVPGATLGRYVILEAVGAGAMGFVYAAYDPELARKVALKLLRPDVSVATLRARLLREARAMARLSHANVIAVHDAGTFGDRVFIAMEFVAGGTLADWLSREERSWRAALDALRQAGEGLAAAHAAGIVHRDFKPENVLVGGDGRVRVTDFGLARGGEPEAGEGEAEVGGGLGPTLTQRGALVGTPAYMAPEQLAGGPATARSDQYAFCVALHEALHGARPSANAPRGRGVPAWIDRVLARGLHIDPEARFPSMRALLDAIAAGPPLGPRRVLVGASLCALIGLAGVAALRPKGAPVCTGAEAAWGDVYGDAEREAVRRAFLARAGASGEVVLATVDRALAAYRGEWMAMHRSACEATRVRGEQSEAMLDRRMECLADRRRAAAALVTVLGRAGRDTLDGAVDAAARLPSIDSCADVRALAMRVPPPVGAAQRGAVERAAGPIAEANALVDLGKPARGLAVLAAAEAPARESGYAGIEARRLFVKGELEYLAGELSSGEETLHAAALAAEAAGDDGLLADVWTVLGRLVGFRRYRAAEGRRWLGYAEAALRRAGGDDERESARLNALAVIAWLTEGRLEEAREILSKERALLAQRCSMGAPEPRLESLRCAKLVELDGGLAGLLSDMGQSGEAIPLFERVRAALAETHGPDARVVTLAMMNEGEALSREGRPAEGLALLLRAQALEEQAGRFVDEGFLRHRTADALRRLGRFEEALAADRASIEALRRVQGGESKPLAWPLTGEGEDLVALGRPREAIAPLERAVALREGSPTSATDLASSRFALARALWDGGGDQGRARLLAEDALRAFSEAAARHGGWFQRARDEVERWLTARPKKG